MKGKIEIPWSGARHLSKNVLYYGGNKRNGMTKEARTEIDGAALELRSKFYGYKWTDVRIKVNIFVFRPRTNIDAQNWVDAVSDLVELAIGVDDSNFDVTPFCVDDKNDPRVVIEVEQDESE